MPNHITNRLTFQGNQEQIKKLVDEITTFIPAHERTAHDGSIICINKETDSYGWLNRETNTFTQRNKETVQGIPEGFSPEIEPDYYHFPDFNKVIPMPKIIEKSFGESGMNPAWYTWSIDNWGTKWNSYSCRKIDDSTFEFETAWSSVTEIVEEISLKYPEVEILYEYSDEDTGYNCGSFNYKAGKSEGKAFEGGSKESYDMAFKLKPDSQQYYIFQDGEWQYKDEDED